MTAPVDLEKTVVRSPEIAAQKKNERAAILATWGGVLMVASGVSGAYQWSQTFAILEAILGSSGVLHIVQLGFVGIGSVGGVFVVLGAYAFWKNRVRTGRFLLWLGTGFTMISLGLLLAVQFIRFDWPFAGASLIGFVGIALCVLARFEARPKRLLP